MYTFICVRNYTLATICGCVNTFAFNRLISKSYNITFGCCANKTPLPVI